MPKTTKRGSAKKSELPSTLQKSAPKAQRTFAKAHDSAAKQYGEGERAHRVAYDALKHSYEKVGDHWEPKAPRAVGFARAQRRAQPQGQVCGRRRRQRIEEASGGSRAAAGYLGPLDHEQGRTGVGHQEGQPARDGAQPLALSGRRRRLETLQQHSFLFEPHQAARFLRVIRMPPTARIQIAY